MAVTRDGIPVRCWTFPGSTGDQKIIRRVKDDLGGWNLRRLVWVADRGFASAANRAYLARGGGHYIHAEKLRDTSTEAAAALARSTGCTWSPSPRPTARSPSDLRPPPASKPSCMPSTCVNHRSSSTSRCHRRPDQRPCGPPARSNTTLLRHVHVFAAQKPNSADRLLMIFGSADWVLAGSHLLMGLLGHGLVVTGTPDWRCRSWDLRLMPQE